MFAELLGRHAEVLAESAVKCSLASETSILICLGDRLVSILEKIAHIFKSGVVQVFVKVRMKST